MPEETWSHQQATVNGLRLHYVRAGRGPALFLLHGWPGFWYDWRLNIPVLAEHFDVIAPDYRGFGASEKPDLPPQEAYSDVALASDIHALARALGLERISVAGYDVGAAVAQRLTRDYPLVERLVLIGPSYPGIGDRWREPSQIPEIWYRYFHQLPWAEELVGASRRTLELYFRHFLSHWSHNPHLLSEEEVERYVDNFAQPGALRGGFNWYRSGSLARLFETNLPPITVPTLVLWPDSERLKPLAWSDRLPEFFTNLTFKVVEGCGHFAQRERPDVINAETIAFLEG